eukprot:6793080-Prymnesium_polylepis.1
MRTRGLGHHAPITPTLPVRPRASVAGRVGVQHDREPIGDVPPVATLARGDEEAQQLSERGACQHGWPARGGAWEWLAAARGNGFAAGAARAVAAILRRWARGRVAWSGV